MKCRLAQVLCAFLVLSLSSCRLDPLPFPVPPMHNQLQTRGVETAVRQVLTGVRRRSGLALSPDDLRCLAASAMLAAIHGWREMVAGSMGSNAAFRADAARLGKAEEHARALQNQHCGPPDDPRRQRVRDAYAWWSAHQSEVGMSAEESLRKMAESWEGRGAERLDDRIAAVLLVGVAAPSWAPIVAWATGTPQGQSLLRMASAAP